MVDLGIISLNNFEFVALLIVFGLIFRWWYNRASGLTNVKVLIINKDGNEGREFKGEESFSENRVSVLKKMGLMKKERLDFKRVASPIVRYVGNMKQIVYKVVEGEGETKKWISVKTKGIIKPGSKKIKEGVDGETSSWSDGSEGKSTAEITYESIGKFRATLNALDAQALMSFKAQLMPISLGLMAGLLLGILLSILFPQVF